MIDILRHALLSMAAVACLFTGQAIAATVNNQNTGLASPDVVVDFGDGLFITSTPVTNQFAGEGVTFGAGYQYADSNESTPAITQGFLFTSTGVTPPGSIFFTSDVTDAVFSWRTNPGTTTFEAYLDGILVETLINAPTFGDTASGHFYGFTGILFDEIRISINAINNGFTLDNLQYNVSAVPLPAALPLFLTMLAGMGFLRWRRNKRAVV